MQDNYAGINTLSLMFELVMRLKPQLIEAANKHGLTTMQLHVLGFLSDDQPHPMSWIAMLMHCDASNVTGIVDRLVAMELVERAEGAKDRRIKMARLTTKGKQMRADIMQELTQESQDSIDGLLDKKEQTCFRELLIRLLNANTKDIDCPASKK
ncbi:MAG TPA: MarR family transcriptional regulator [Candidatus Saccharimonadales bacterium]|nr:MarR family transcriptional regulator [Candidatus Saccharimonadales bacterium]